MEFPTAFLLHSMEFPTQVNHPPMEFLTLLTSLPWNFQHYLPPSHGISSILLVFLTPSLEFPVQKCFPPWNFPFGKKCPAPMEFSGSLTGGVRI